MYVLWDFSVNLWSKSLLADIRVTIHCMDPGLEISLSHIAIPLQAVHIAAAIAMLEAVIVVAVSC